MAAELLKTCRKRECALYWQDSETGVDCKGRIDAIRDDCVIDYKTAANAGTDVFKREALKYGYDLQAAMYMEAARANGYNPPYLINVIRAGEAFVDRGMWIMRDLLKLYKMCRDTNTWPGYGENVLILNEWEAMSDE